MKAIQTRYAGHYFRSRLEAKWAVFFDALGIEWEYEPEGYEFSNGRRYLPDFYLPACGTWIEVKGDPRYYDRDLMLTAARELPNNPTYGEQGPVLMTLGNIPRPTLRDDVVWTFNGFRREGRFTDSERWSFNEFTKNNRPWWVDGTYSPDPLKATLEPEENDCHEAYAAARSARFEHGEEGAT